MANKDNKIGGKAVGTIHSATFNSVTNRYVIPESDSDYFFLNDFVKTNNTSENGLPVCLKSGNNDVPRGLVVGFEVIKDYENEAYRKPNTRRVVHVADDPDIIFEMQVNAEIISTDIGKNYDLAVANGSLATGVSGTQIDVSTKTTGPAIVKILSIIEEENNSLGEFAKVKCMFVEHELANSGTYYQKQITLSTVDPTVNDDITKHYGKGDRWQNITTQKEFVCVDETAGAAIWQRIAFAGVDSVQTLVAGSTIPSNYRTVPIDSASNIILTSNPQIAAGIPGQKITIVCADSSHTQQLVEGNGLKLDNGQFFVMGQNDNITLVYYNSLWIEVSRVATV
jgi:hypothetical protein